MIKLFYFAEIYVSKPAKEFLHISGLLVDNDGLLAIVLLHIS